MVLLLHEPLELRWSSTAEARYAELGPLRPWPWVPATRLPPHLRTSAGLGVSRSRASAPSGFPC